MDIENDHTSSAHLDLFGRDLGERAITEMWNRRMELEILEPIANAFRHRVPLFANRLRHQYAEAQRAVAEDHLGWLDHVLADRPFIAGDHFSVAHITAFWGVDFGRVSGISVKPDQANLLRWFEAVARRTSTRA